VAHSTHHRPGRKLTPAQLARRRRKRVRRRAQRAEGGKRIGLVVFLEWVRTFGVVGWFDGHVVERASQAVFHKTGCFVALLVRATMGIGGMGDLVSYIRCEGLSGALGFAKELTFVNPLADLLKEFTEAIINDLLEEVLRTLVREGVQLGEVVAIDSSFLHVFGKTYEGAARGFSGHLGKTALGYKLHLAYDVQLRLPLAIWITSGKGSDSSSLKVLRERVTRVMGKRPNQMFLLDRGYFDAAALDTLDQDDALFVCRAKLVPNYIKDAVAALKDEDFTYRAKNYRLATTTVVEPTKLIVFRLVVVRHVAFPKPMILVCNATEIRPVQVYRLYKKRFHIEAAFQELRGKWHLNRFVGTRLAQVIGHIGIAVLALTLHRCFREGLQRRTARVGTKTLRREVYQAPVPDVPETATSRDLSRLPVHRLLRELVKLLQTGATRAKALLIRLLGTSIPKPRILILDLVEP